MEEVRGIGGLRSLEDREIVGASGEEPPMTLAEIEQAKHAASWLNSLATNLATTGAIAPLIAYIAYIAGTPASGGGFGVLLALAAICFLLAFILHEIGSDILAEIWT
jgi:hypothetical protein